MGSLSRRAAPPPLPTPTNWRGGLVQGLSSGCDNSGRSSSVTKRSSRWPPVIELGHGFVASVRRCGSKHGEHGGRDGCRYRASSRWPPRLDAPENGQPSRAVGHPPVDYHRAFSSKPSPPTAQDRLTGIRGVRCLSVVPLISTCPVVFPRETPLAAPAGFSTADAFSGLAELQRGRQVWDTAGGSKHGPLSCAAASALPRGAPSNAENLPPKVLEQVSRELCELLRQPAGHVYVTVNEEDVTDVEIAIEGPRDTPSSGGVFKPCPALLRDFPVSPPRSFFMARNLLPYVAVPSDEIFVNTLKEDWKPNLGLQQILLTIKYLLNVPNTGSVVNEEGGRMLLERTIAAGSGAICTSLVAGGGPFEVFVVGLPISE